MRLCQLMNSLCKNIIWRAMSNNRYMQSCHNFFFNFVIPPDSLQRKMFFCVCLQRQRYVVMCWVFIFEVLLSPPFYVKHLSDSSCRPCAQSVAIIFLPMTWRHMQASVERGNRILAQFSQYKNMSRYCSILVRDIPPIPVFPPMD